MSEPKFTKGPYLRAGTTVYALQHAGWRKGEEQFCNRIYANVQRGPGCSMEEAEAVACLFQAAPELLEALADVFEMTGPNELKDIFGLDWYEKAKAALAKTTGAAND